MPYVTDRFFLFGPLEKLRGQIQNLRKILEFDRKIIHETQT